jgi:general secretion pathway protein A
MSVVKGIHRRTRGIPRLINLLCDRMLLGAYGKGASRVDKAMLTQAAREVMGETTDSEPRGGARWGIAAAALVLVASGLVWWQWNPGPKPTSTAASTAPPPAQPVEAPADTQSAPAAVAAEPVAEPEPESAGGPPSPADWLLPPDSAMALLWSLNADSPMPDDPCAVDAAGLRCGSGVAATWDELATMNRPLLLDAVTPARFAAGVLLLGVDGRQAWVAVEDGVEQIALAELAASWRGGYRYLWRPPTGFERPLALGDSSPAVAAIAALFARLDGQSQPLSGEVFNDALRTRVRLFQAANGLDNDGVIGEQTLLKLNEQLGIDATATAARESLGSAVDALASRTAQ